MAAEQDATCVLTAVPVPEDADDETRRDAERYLRCRTCSALIPVAEIVGGLRPGQCPTRVGW